MKLWLYYDDVSGQIKGISPGPLDDGMGEPLVLDTPTLDRIFDKTRLITDYRVIDGKLEETDKPAPLSPGEQVHNYDHQRVYQVTHTTLPNADIVVRNNVRTKTIYIYLGPYADPEAMAGRLQLWWTDRDNPYRLRYYLEVSGTPYRWRAASFPYNPDLSNCSLYTYRIYPTYTYQECHERFGWLRHVLHNLRRTKHGQQLG